MNNQPEVNPEARPGRSAKRSLTPHRLGRIGSPAGQNPSRSKARSPMESNPAKMRKRTVRRLRLSRNRSPQPQQSWPRSWKSAKTLLFARARTWITTGSGLLARKRTRFATQTIRSSRACCPFLITSNSASRRPRTHRMRAELFRVWKWCANNLRISFATMASRLWTRLGIVLTRIFTKLWRTSQAWVWLTAQLSGSFGKASN